MHISVRYRPDLAETIRLNLYLCRKSVWFLTAAGVVEIIAGPATLPAAAAFFYLLGGVFIIETPLLVLVRVYRHREILLEEAEVTLTSEGIERRTESYALRVTWEKVERADERKDDWIFITKKPVRCIALLKRRLSQEQQAELAAFIEARHLNKPVREHMAAVQVHSADPAVEEASYALAYGVARSDLKPEVQAEYDRLAAEQDSPL
jgi:hypothetical protein